MKRLTLMLLALCALAAPIALFAADSMPAVGQVAPAFKLQDQNGKWQSLEQYKGDWVVLYFYPKDFTPGCTTEVCKFRDDYLKIRKEGAHVLAVSLDDVKSHAAFAKKYHAPFPMLADTSHTVAGEYGVLTSMMGIHYAKRTTFIIDPQGRIAKVYVGVDPGANSAQIIADLPRLKAADKT